MYRLYEDTTPEAEEMQIELLRRASVTRRFRNYEFAYRDNSLAGL